MKTFLFLFASISKIIISTNQVQSLQSAPPPKTRVIITGAAGRTGKLIFKSLSRSCSRFEPVGVVRTESGAKKLIKETKCGLEHVWVCDVTKLNPEKDSSLPNGLSEAESLIICTSAVPKIMKRTLMKAILKVPINIVRRKKAIHFSELQFRYRDGQHPEKVDYMGQIAQIDLAKRLGISHVVLVSSMGVTNPDDFLNSIGKDKDGNGHGDLLIWKRKAEEYLIKSGLDYTIIHPGGLRDQPGGKSEFILDVNDHLRKQKQRFISRADLASLCIAALTIGKGKKVSFDCITKQVDNGNGGGHGASRGSGEVKVKPASIAISEFIETSKQYDYSM